MISAPCGVTPISPFLLCEEILGGSSYTSIKKGDFSFKVSQYLRYQEIESSAKLSNAKVHRLTLENIEGTSIIEYLMSYTVHGTATFVGLERVSGTSDGKTGTFVLQHTVGFSEGKARSSWSIVPGSGTGDLVSILGMLETPRL
ncbi:MAG: DUF3224 domain-containing protein [Leptospirales bacterium]